GADERDGAAQRPHQQNEHRLVDNAGDVRWISKDADADDAAGNDDDGVEQSELAAELDCQVSTLKSQLSTAASEPVKTRPFDASRITDSESDVSFIDEPNVNLSPPGTV